MKRRNIALTLVASFCFSGAVGTSESHADNPFEKLIPRGKLLKKLKDEFAGEDDKIKLPDPRRGFQTRSNAVPTPADPVDYASRNTQPREPRRVTARPQAPMRTRPLPPISITPTDASEKIANATGNRGPGFGMMVQNSQDNHLVVTGVQRGGNAAFAGIRSGDRLVSVGGGELSGMAELKQIAKTLGQGDLVEVVFSRQGKKQKSLLQFGTAPKEEKVASTDKVDSAVTTSASIDSTMPSVLDSPVERVSRLDPAAGGPAVPTKASNGKITSLNQTIEQQQIKMAAMAEELELLRKAHQPAVEPTENNWSFPDLAGPEAN
jgi:membrane-associated protease RseP (regulator of RpoE activity)